MYKNDKNQITHEGELKLGDIIIPCYVLENGTRVISGRGMQDALKVGEQGDKSAEQKSGSRLAVFLNAKAFKPFMGKEQELGKISSIICWKGNQKITGYEATVLADICDAVLDARNAGVKLTDKQQMIAIQCEILIRSFAKVGIIALVDEATGYEKVKESDALQQFLQKFLEDEKGKWVRTFPPEFFESIFKMKGWTWKQASTKKPQVVGHYINNYVYSRLAPQVLTELRKLNPKGEKGHRKGKHPQWINPDFGHPKLKEHLSILNAFAKATGYNWTNWTRMVERALPKFDQDGSAAQQLPFSDD